jgi:signal transduction histidine kinase
MWKQRWKKWTIDKPALFGDWLWDVFVVQLAAWLDRLTLRQIIAFIPVVILVAAYYHRIPIPPELLLVGDLLAYIDIFSVLFLLGILARAAAMLFVAKQVTARLTRLASSFMTEARRLDFRHRRERGTKVRNRQADRPSNDDSEPIIVGDMAWA